MDLLDLAIRSFVTFLVVIDPIGTAAVFVGIAAHEAPRARRRSAIRGVIIATIVLLGFAFLGEPLLRALGIGLPAFRIAGGALLFLLAIDMVFARRTGLRATTPGEEAEAAEREDVAVFPLAIPLLAGPGAITSVLLLAGGGPAGGPEAMMHLGVVVGVLLAVMIASLVCLLAADLLARGLGETGVNVVSRLLGLLLAALAVQFVADGVMAFLPMN
ncbi:MAG: MarC family protein [Alphaproteobacteria bacterium]